VTWVRLARRESSTYSSQKNSASLDATVSL